MGAVAGEEIKKLENTPGTNAREEKILVLVRLRPLSEKEISMGEVADWECINDTTILYRNTLREGSALPNAYTFDRVFRGDCPTKQVYAEGTRDIALSVVSGVNSTIFAYGQTSSGKTYTMDGITEYAVAEIFDYIKRHEERAFVLKLSAIEIYNEVVRDLLSADNAPLRLLDDPERGTVVERVIEENLRDWNHFKELFSVCEAQRKIGETSLNEKSSRSHQIIRLSIESSAREFLGKDNSTALAASVNFVDLAGSERASQALSAGTRLKEGCHINRSLLTLGTVIRKLSKGRHGHINYRDSKLTRILQPCLGGNARTAVICTLSPARAHVEQTRNTLLFACCAREVSTKAQVNVVMSDKALVKHLQRELARLESELRSPVTVSSNIDYAVVLKKKDLQIEKMEKEIKELTKQRDLAQSHIDDLLRMIGHDQEQTQTGTTNDPRGQEGNTWEYECSPSETSSLADSSSLTVGVKMFNNPQYYDPGTESNPEENYLKGWEKTKSHSLSDGAPWPLANGNTIATSDFHQSQGDTEFEAAENSEDCKEVQCVEVEVLSRDNHPESPALSSVENGGMTSLMMESGNDSAGQHVMLTPKNGNREVSRMENKFGENVGMQNNLTDGTFEKRMLIDSPVSPYPYQPSVQNTADIKSFRSPIPSAQNTADIRSFRSPSLIRSFSCRASLMRSASSFGIEESTPYHGCEKVFLERPDSFQWRLPPLPYHSRFPRFDSQSSVGSVQSIDKSGDEGIPSLDNFVAGLKEMAKKQVDGEEMVSEGGKLSNTDKKNVEVDLMPPEAIKTPPDWKEEFQRRQGMILELWQTCNVSLVHRTYFFLLFQGDPMDSIYMEVELRRLNFLKVTFAQGNQARPAVGIPSISSSIRALRQEREMLSRLMRKRLSEEERRRLFQRWGIALNSKRRRLQLASCLWSNWKDMNHVIESAAIVAKLVRFAEQGHAIEGMFELSFTPTQAKRRSLVSGL